MDCSSVKEEVAMDYLLIYALLILVVVFNVFISALQWATSLAGMLGVFVITNIAACVFSPFCPPASIMRRLCGSLGSLAR